VRDLATAFKERGEEVTVLAGSGGPLFDALKKRGVNYRLLKNMVHPINPFKDLAAYREIKDRLRELKPELVSTHSNKAGFLGRLAANKLGITVIHTSHGFLFGGRKQTLTCRFYRLMEKYAAARGDLVIAVAQSEFDLAAGLNVIPPQKMVVIHNGLPVSEISSFAKPEKEPTHLIMVARFVPPKDHGTLIRALGGLKELPWRLTLVGDGKGQAAAEKLVNVSAITDRVDFVGLRDDIEELLSTASIFVLSSLREGFPISILEAMRAGLPVVASRVGGIPEAVVEGETGFLFEPGDELSLRSRLAELIANPALCLQMGQAGQKRFQDKFTLDQMVEQTASIYKKLVNHNTIT